MKLIFACFLLTVAFSQVVEITSNYLWVMIVKGRIAHNFF